MSESTYYRIQDEDVFPVTNDAWKKHQQEISKSVSGPLSIIGDGRCNNPRYSAKYGTYTIIDQNTEEILDFQLGKVANSVAMEKTGLERSLQYLLDEGLSINQLATDRHPQITSFIHQLNISTTYSMSLNGFLRSSPDRESKKLVRASFHGYHQFAIICGGLLHLAMVIEKS